MVSSPCPSRERLLAFALGQLPDQDNDAIADHLDHCAACESLIATVDEVSDTLVLHLRDARHESATAQEAEYQQAIAHVKAICLGDPAAASAASGDEHVGPALLGSLGEYQLLAKLGEGGMGVVYKAEHTKLKRFVALKVLPQSRVHRDGTIARFEREMEAIGRVSHPNIVQAYDAREIDGTRLLVMEYVDGLNLDQLVRRLGPLPIPEACELIRQAADGLQYAHEHGLIHRDIKPSNVMLSGDGRMKILDLGLALLKSPPDTASRADQAADPDLTDTRQIMGTASYMAPEQSSDCHQVDIRADIYSLGCTLYKLLTGRPPFVGEDCRTPLDQMLAHRTKPVEPIRQLRSEIPAALAAVIERMLAKDPADRFAAPAEVAEALKPFTVGCDLNVLLQGDPAELEARPILPASRGVSPPTRHRRLALAAGGAGAILLLGIILTLSTAKGTVQLDFSDEDAARQCVISIDGDAIRLENLGEPIKLWPGKHQLRVTHGDLTIETREFDIMWRSDRILHVSTSAPPDEAKKSADLKRAEDLDQRFYGYAEGGFYDRAIAGYSEIIDLAPDLDWPWQARALAELSDGQLDAYRRHCEDMLRHFGPMQNLAHSACSNVCEACILVPDAVSDWSTVLALADRAVKNRPENIEHFQVRAEVLYRAGRWEESLKPLMETHRLRQNPENPFIRLSDAEVCAFLAMSHHRLGRREEAQEWFDTMARQADFALEEHRTGKVFFGWNILLPIRLLRAEAADLLGISDESPGEEERPQRTQLEIGHGEAESTEGTKATSDK